MTTEFPNKSLSETVFLPKDFIALGDKPIRSLPLINTSLFGLSAEGWWLFVTCRYVPSYGHSKLRYRFSSPKQAESNRYLIFNFWLKEHLSLISSEREHRLLELIHKVDFQPNFNKPANFTLIPFKEERWPYGLDSPKAVVQKELVYEDELSFLNRVNEEREKLLPKKSKKVTETPLPPSDNVVDINGILRQAKEDAQRELRGEVDSRSKRLGSASSFKDDPQGQIEPKSSAI